jgi:hypothetical protein
VLAARAARLVPARLLLPCTLALTGLAVMVTVHLLVLSLALVLAGVMMALYSVYTVRAQTLYQLKVADGFRGRVFGALETTTALVMLVGMALGSTLGDVVGVVPLFDFAGCLRILAGAAALYAVTQRRAPHRGAVVAATA